MPVPSAFSISPATSPQDIETAKLLFEAYKKSLDLDLSFQNYACELASLPGVYAPPGGRLLFARAEDEAEDGDEDGDEGRRRRRNWKAVGCIALRPLKLPTHNSPNHLSNPKTEFQAENSECERNDRDAEEGEEEERCCEIKRLYVVPEARGMGLGRALVGKVLEQAREAGYRRVRLDTLEHMTAAIRLYEGFGFERCERYYDTPLRGTVFLGLELRGLDA